MLGTPRRRFGTAWWVKVPSSWVARSLDIWYNVRPSTPSSANSTDIDNVSCFVTVSMSPPIPVEQWAKHKDEIQRLYFTEGLPLKLVMRKLRSPDFNPSESQYRTKLKKWPHRKPRNFRQRPSNPDEPPHTDQPTSTANPTKEGLKLTSNSSNPSASNETIRNNLPPSDLDLRPEGFPDTDHFDMSTIAGPTSEVNDLVPDPISTGGQDILEAPFESPYDQVYSDPSTFKRNFFLRRSGADLSRNEPSQPKVSQTPRQRCPPPTQQSKPPLPCPPDIPLDTSSLPQTCWSPQQFLLDAYPPVSRGALGPDTSWWHEPDPAISGYPPNEHFTDGSLQ
ncbi:MAG: hypothetical protein Q9222_005662 [Ikaeria aurantiellina]